MAFVETFSSFTLQDPGSANQTHVSWGTQSLTAVNDSSLL